METVGWAWTTDHQSEAVYNSIENALKRTGAHPIIHSDHGREYTSHKYEELVEEYKFRRSMERTSISTDNYPIENLWRRLKSECINITIPYEKDKDVTGVIYEIDKYFRYHNKERLNIKDLGGRSSKMYLEDFGTGIKTS